MTHCTSDKDKNLMFGESIISKVEAMKNQRLWHRDAAALPNVDEGSGQSYMDVMVTDASYRSMQIMGEDVLVLYFSLSDYLEIPLGTYVAFQGVEYSLVSPATIQMVNSCHFDLTLYLESPSYALQKYIFRNPVDHRTRFSYTARPQEHAQMLCDNLNMRRQDGTWAVGECLEAVEKVISYDNNYCLDALKAMADAFETEYEIVHRGDEHIVNLRKIEYNKNLTDALPLRYGKGQGLKSGLQRAIYDQSKRIEVLNVQGGERNIDRSVYGNDTLLLPPVGTRLAFDGTDFVTSNTTNYTDYPAQSSLQYSNPQEDEQANLLRGGQANLPTERELDFLGNGSVSSPTIGISQIDSTSSQNVVRVYEVIGDRTAIRRADKPLSTYVEDCLDCSEIYPRREGTVSAVEELQNENSPIYKFQDESNTIDYSAADLRIKGETAVIVFQSGMLAGREFEMLQSDNRITGYDHETKTWTLSREEIDGVLMPGGVFVPAIGDRYAIFNISLPEYYVREAEDEMFRKAVRYLYENEEQKYTYTGEVDGLWSKGDWENIGGKLKLGSYVRFSDARFQVEDVLIRITGVRNYITNPYAPTVELSNETVGSSLSGRLQQLESQEVIEREQRQMARQYTRRRFRDALDTMSALGEALGDRFTEGISPITVQTMGMLVGDESLQFRFVTSRTEPQPLDVQFVWDNVRKILYSEVTAIASPTANRAISSGQDTNSFVNPTITSRHDTIPSANSAIVTSQDTRPTANSTISPSQDKASLTNDTLLEDAGPLAYNETLTMATAAIILQHQTYGLERELRAEHQPEDYRYWTMASYESASLTDTKRRFLYARVPVDGDTGEFRLEETAVNDAMSGADGYLYLLVGILNAEYDGERSFVSLYGFTEILPGRITTDRIVSTDGLTYFDLANGEIGGVIRFLSDNGYLTLIDGGYIKTSLINVDELVAKRLRAVDGGNVVDINARSAQVEIYNEGNQNNSTILEGGSYNDVSQLYGDSSGSLTIVTTSKEWTCTGFEDVSTGGIPPPTQNLVSGTFDPMGENILTVTTPCEFNIRGNITVGVDGAVSLSNSASRGNRDTKNISTRNSVDARLANAGNGSFASGAHKRLSNAEYEGVFNEANLKIRDKADGRVVNGAEGWAPIVALGSASIELVLCQYGDDNQIVSRVIIATAYTDESTGTKSLQIDNTMKAGAGRYALQVSYRLFAYNSRVTSRCSYSIGAATYKSQFYVSRYFANGFCLGSRQDNYIMAWKNADEKMQFAYRNESTSIQMGDTGLKVEGAIGGNVRIISSGTTAALKDTDHDILNRSTSNISISLPPNPMQGQQIRIWHTRDTTITLERGARLLFSMYHGNWVESLQHTGREVINACYIDDTWFVHEV